MEKLMQSAEVADLLGITPGTLRNWRYFGQGPEFIRIGRKHGAVRYRRSDVDEWLRGLEPARPLENTNSPQQ